MDTPYVKDDFVAVTAEDGTVSVARVTHLVDDSYTSAEFSEGVSIKNGETLDLSLPFKITY